MQCGECQNYLKKLSSAKYEYTEKIIENWQESSDQSLCILNILLQIS